MLCNRLLKPLDYLRIHVVEKSCYDYVYPFLFGTFFTALFYFSPVKIQIFGNNGVIHLVTGILQILTGFYIASLAAVATFNKPEMDSQMPGKPPELMVLMNGVKVSEKLTRRRFLCLMLGYLAFISIFLYFIGGIFNLFAPHASAMIAPAYIPYVKWGFVWGYLLVTCNLVVTTLLALFYMIDRIHRE